MATSDDRKSRLEKLFVQLDMADLVFTVLEDVRFWRMLNNSVVA